MLDVVAALLSVALTAFALYYLLDIAEWRRRRFSGRERRRALSEAARELGFAFEPGARSLEEAPFLAFPLFSRGRGRDSRNLLVGKIEGIELRAFDYRWTPGDGSGVLGERPVEATVAGLPSLARLPDFTLRPESVADRVLRRGDVDFEEDPEFSDAYFLQGEDEAAVRALFGPDVRRFLLARPGWFLEGGGWWLVAYREEPVPPERLAAFLHEALALARLLGAQS